MNKFKIKDFKKKKIFNILLLFCAIEIKVLIKVLILDESEELNY